MSFDCSVRRSHHKPQLTLKHQISYRYTTVSRCSSSVLKIVAYRVLPQHGTKCSDSLRTFMFITVSNFPYQCHDFPSPVAANGTNMRKGSLNGYNVCTQTVETVARFRYKLHQATSMLTEASPNGCGTHIPMVLVGRISQPFVSGHEFWSFLIFGLNGDHIMIGQFFGCGCLQTRRWWTSTGKSVLRWCRLKNKIKKNWVFSVVVFVMSVVLIFSFWCRFFFGYFQNVVKKMYVPLKIHLCASSNPFSSQHPFSLTHFQHVDTTKVNEKKKKENFQSSSNDFWKHRKR